MIGKNVSHYKILEKIGEGGMGVVYKAQDTKLDRIVALKFLPQYLSSDPAEKERFFHEAKTASALNHPNITTIHAIDEFEGQVYIVMEYVEGKTVNQLIESESLPVKKILDIAIQIGEGLLTAHEKHIVHRDIKSDNIKVTPKGQVKIMDFGLAKLKGSTKLTKAGTTLGTAAYMSPEQAQAEEVDHRSDIFSFGVVLYEMLSGKLPFGGEHHAAIVYSILNEEPQPLARFNNKISADLERIVAKTLAKDKEERYQHVDDLLADLRREKKSLEYTKSSILTQTYEPVKPKKNLLKILVPASVLVIVASLFFILNPFKLELTKEQTAQASENSLAVMYFENLVDREDKERTGEIVTNLLITDLSESQYMNVVSSQRLYDILKLLGKEGTKVIDKDIATQVATKAQAKWMLLGSILQLEPQVIMTSQLVEIKSGRVIASQRINGEKGETIFSLVDKLTLKVKNGLTLPAEAQKEKTPQVADVTTHSAEAYRYYLEGINYVNKLYVKEAKQSFWKALELDSTFAMAYYKLASLASFPGFTDSPEEAKKMLAKASKYSNKVTEKEKHYIKVAEALVAGKTDQVIKELQKIVERYPQEKEALGGLGFAYYNLAQYNKAIEYLNKVLEIDPLYKMAYNMLAYCYDGVGDFEKSIGAINKYISLAPEEANPYDTRADLYAYNGKLDQAIESYKRAIEIKPDFYASVRKLGDMYLFKRDYKQAENYFQMLVSSEEKYTRSFGRISLALIPLYQGKFNQALQILDQGLATDKMERIGGWMEIAKHLEKASIYEAQSKFDLALKEIEICMETVHKMDPSDPVYFRDYYIYLLTQKGDIKKAEETARTLKADIEKKDVKKMYAYWLMASLIEKVKGKKETSVSYLEKVAKELTEKDFVARYFLCQAYLQTGRLDEAVSGLEKILNSFDEKRASVPIWSIKADYLLGLAYEKSGWKQKAIEEYQEFLDIWKEADSGIPEVADAKQRLAKLKSSA